MFSSLSGLIELRLWLLKHWQVDSVSLLHQTETSSRLLFASPFSLDLMIVLFAVNITFFWFLSLDECRFGELWRDSDFYVRLRQKILFQWDSLTLILLFFFSSLRPATSSTSSSFIFFSTASSCKVDRRALCASRGRLRGKSYTIQRDGGSVLSCSSGVEKVLVCCEMLFNTERSKNLRTLESKRDNCQKEEGKKLNSNRFSFLWTLKHTLVAIYKASRWVSIYSRSSQQPQSWRILNFWFVSSFVKTLCSSEYTSEWASQK